MNRAQRRKLGIKKKPEMKKKLNLFGKLPTSCAICDHPFDKKSKKMVQTWSVVVREEEERVNLYCPTCWNKAKNFIKQTREELNESKS